MNEMPGDLGFSYLRRHMRSLSIFTLLLLFSVPVFCQEDDKARDLYAEGLRQFYAKDYSYATELLSESIDLNPDFYMAYFSRAKAYMQLKDWANAEADLSTVLQHDDQQVEAWFLRGKAKVKSGRFLEAAEDYVKALELHPANVEYQKELAIAFYYHRDYKAAIEMYEAIVKANPKDLGSHYQLGLSRYYNDDYEAAAKAFDAIIDQNSQHVQALEMRGNVYFKANLLSKACEDWQAASDLGHSNADEMLVKYCE